MALCKQDISPPGIVTRPATLQDAPAVAALAHALAAYEGEACRFTVEHVRDEMAANPPLLNVLVAQRNADGEVLGAAFSYPGYDLATATRGVHLGDLIVREDARGQGIGTALMRALAAQTLAEGGAWMAWSVLRNNKRAIDFYRHFLPEAPPVSPDVTFLTLGAAALNLLAGQGK